MDWEAWLMGQHLLEDGQVWENGNDVIQIDRRGDESYQVIMFKPVGNRLTFHGAAVYDRTDQLMRFLTVLKMKPTSKIITLTRNQIAPDSEGERDG